MCSSLNVHLSPSDSKWCSLVWDLCDKSFICGSIKQLIGSTLWREQLFPHRKHQVLWSHLKVQYPNRTLLQDKSNSCFHKLHRASQCFDDPSSWESRPRILDELVHLALFSTYRFASLQKLSGSISFCICILFHMNLKQVVFSKLYNLDQTFLCFETTWWSGMEMQWPLPF